MILILYLSFLYKSLGDGSWIGGSLTAAHRNEDECSLEQVSLDINGL